MGEPCKNPPCSSFVYFPFFAVVFPLDSGYSLIW